MGSGQLFSGYITNNHLHLEIFQNTKCAIVSLEQLFHISQFHMETIPEDYVHRDNYSRTFILWKNLKRT